MRKISFGNRLRYRFDNTMSKGPIALIGWLFFLSAAFIIAVTVIVLILGIGPQNENGQPLGFFDTVWFGLMRTLDPGTMGSDAGPWPFLLAMLVVTLGGIFVVSTLIGVLTSSIEHRLEQLRKGRSFVVEENHTVILGWSPQIFSIISELVIANANQKQACIAILADKDKVEMEDDIRDRIGATGRTRVVCRSGNPTDMTDLEIINPHDARSIIILAPEVDDPDPHVLKTILALTNNPERRERPYHIVTEMRHAKNQEVAKLVGHDEIEVILTGDLISRIAVQTCRQSGLSVVYTELLDFGGDEIYFQEEPVLVGKTFAEALLAYEDSAIIGLCDKDGHVLLNPPMDTRVKAGDQVIAISEDDDTVRLSGLSQVPIDNDAIREARLNTPAPERTLILGWNNRAPTIINELNKYVASGSQVTVVAEIAEARSSIERDCAALQNLSVTFQLDDTTDRHTLEALAIHTYQHVIVLGYADKLDAQEADAKTLITLLHLRDMAERFGQHFAIVSEMLDIRNRELAEVTHADDFIVSDKLVSLMLSQISENKALADVFADLFDPQGSELYLKPICDYVESGRAVSFYTVVESARQRSEVAIGYRLKAYASDAARAYGIVVNPDKSERVSFSEEDRVIVLAES